MGPISIVAGAVIALAISIYNARKTDRRKERKIGFTPLEELNNGFMHFLMGISYQAKKE